MKNKRLYTFVYTNTTSRCASPHPFCVRGGATRKQQRGNSLYTPLCGLGVRTTRVIHVIRSIAGISARGFPRASDTKAWLRQLCDARAHASSTQKVASFPPLCAIRRKKFLMQRRKFSNARGLGTKLRNA